MMKRPLLLSLFSLLAGPLVGAIAFWSAVSQRQAVTTLPALESGYTVSILETGTEVGLFSAQPRYQIFISMKASPYGHPSDLSLYNHGEDVVRYLQRSRVTESIEGIIFTQASGHTLFVPRQWYAGGR
ncbi:hypothetical protein IV454_27485 [Massilia antarctica]|uniref:Uncharacterized protein n=1 Tax=Massilia antarctica TaxID=2765360 RepID=A0AA48WCT9_9BURK|nr:hypothetical protein [Massilia antarctica]QPI49169.1 hypothetical protein IV454_27485 [Massilia antarctica]